MKGTSHKRPHDSIHKKCVEEASPYNRKELGGGQAGGKEWKVASNFGVMKGSEIQGWAK